MVTQGPLRRLTLGGDLYVGGYVNYSAPGLLQRKRRLRGIVGCIRSLKINDKVYEMSRGAFIGDALRHTNIGMFTYSLHGIKCNIFTFCVSRRRRKMYRGHARLCVCLCVCLQGVGVSVRGRMPTLLHGPGCNLG